MIILGAIWIPSDFENPDKKNPNSFIGFRDPKNPLVKIHVKSRLKSVKRTLDKYDGELVIEYDKDVFSAKILIPIP